MRNILITLATQAKKNGNFSEKTVLRMIDYNNHHPMWRVTAGDAEIAAYDAIYSDYKASKQ